MKKIGFSGTLDPITNGHMWVIQEARTLADEVMVFISENPFKKPQFSAEKRKAIVEQSLAAQGWHNVSVVIVKGDYTARAAKRHGIDYLIRGIRNQASNADEAELFTRTQGIINTYSAVMSRGANVTTDASRHRAEELLNTASTPEVYNRVLDTMQSEIDMALKSPGQMRKFFADKYGKEVLARPGAEPATPAVPAAATAAPAAPTIPPRPAAVPAGSQYNPSRHMWRAPGGQLFGEQGQAVQ